MHGVLKRRKRHQRSPPAAEDTRSIDGLLASLGEDVGGSSAPAAQSKRAKSKARKDAGKLSGGSAGDGGDDGAAAAFVNGGGGGGSAAETSKDQTKSKKKTNKKKAKKKK